jgi:hypothetical protein
MTGTWAIFNDDDTCRVGGYPDEKTADEDLWGRPDGCRVAPSCECTDRLRPADECPVCRPYDEDEGDDDDDE